MDGFLLQETTFPFEVIVHDDASTDKTASIIREYEKKYPEIIKPIYQKENQFSKGKKITFECVFPHVRGEYIAFCEGDDFWCNNRKLQKQVDFLYNNSEYSACFHPVKVINTDNIFMGKYLGPKGNGNGDSRMRDNIQGGFIHLSSLLMRSTLIKSGMPKWAIESIHGDFALFLFVTANGKVYFIDEVMSSHRVGVKDSVMTKFRENYSVDNEINYHKQRIKTLEEANKYYNYKFNDDIEKVVFDSETKNLLLKKEYKTLFSKKYKLYFKNKGLKGILKFIFLTKMPNISRRLSLIKNKIKINLKFKYE